MKNVKPSLKKVCIAAGILFFLHSVFRRAILKKETEGFL